MTPPSGDAREGRDAALDLAGVAHIDRDDLHPQRGRRGLDRGELADPGGYGGIPKDCRSGRAWSNLFKQLQPLCSQAIFERDEPSGVTARPCKAIDKAGANRIGNDREHDWYGAGRL